jgi:Ras GTPase-activating protein 3
VYSSLPLSLSFIGEAKNLVGRSATSSNARDIYCTIALDQEEICRTQSQRTQSPFFGEEFSFEIPRKFRYLSVYVLERDRHLKQDKAIGKIAIRRGDLHLYNHKDHWFPLRPVDDDSEVQGMAHIEVKIIDDDDHAKENFKSTSNNYTTTTILSPASHQTSNHKSPKLLHSTHSTQQIVQRSSSQQDVSLKQQGNFLRVPYTNSFHQNQRIQVRLKGCSDLTKKNNQCDPYALITALYTNKRKITRRTKVRKKTIHPTFDDVFEFNLYDFTHGSGSHGPSDSKIYTVTPFGGNDLCEIVVQLWHSAGMADDNFLGEVRLPARGKQELQYLQQSAWYFLLPRSTQSRPAKSCATPPGTRLSCENSLGSLRLSLHYQADHVFPLANYDQLLNLLIQSVDQRPITASAVYLLGEMVANKQEIAQPLVRLFTHNKRIVDIIQRLAEYEICKLTDPTTIFRGNTLVSKMMDEAMKLSGLHYLHSTLRPIVELILHEKKCCEIDPARINREKTSIEQNLNNLHEYVEQVFDAIVKSYNKCPRVLCEIFHNMRTSATKYFPQNKEVNIARVRCAWLHLITLCSPLGTVQRGVWLHFPPLLRARHSRAETVRSDGRAIGE